MSNNVDRFKLLAALNLCKSALANAAFVPAYTHFMFADDGITAFNDLMAVWVSIEHDLSACVPGNKLLQTLNSLNAASVHLQPHPSEAAVVVQAGRSKLKLPTLPVEDFPIQWPDLKRSDRVEFNQDVLNGIRLCLPSVGTNINHPAQMGVTLDFDEDRYAVLWSTDAVSMSQYATNTEVQLPGDTPVIMPTKFCEQLLTMAKFYGEDVTIHLVPGALLAVFAADGGGEVARLMCRTVVDVQPLEFFKVKTRHTTRAPDYAEIPAGWEEALHHANIVVGDAGEKSRTAVIDATRAKGLRITALADSESEDVLDFTGSLDEVPVKVDPVLLLRGSKHVALMSIAKSALLMKSADDSFFHMLAYSTNK